MESPRQFPESNRMSVLAAMILLAYAFTPFVDLVPREIGVQLPGFYLAVTFNFQTIIAVLAAALAAAGMNWLLSDHPRLADLNRRERLMATLPHALIPALTAWVIGVPLANLAQGPAWWAVFAMGGALLITVFIAEYVVVDIADVRHPLAAMGLTALSYALYLILAVALRAGSTRLYLALPALIPAAGLVALRTLYLRLGGRWMLAWSIGIGWVLGVIAIGLHYLPLPPLRFGLLLVGPLYALTSLAGALEEGDPLARSLAEPLVMLTLMVGLAIWVG